MLYRILKIIVTVGIRLYYRQIKVINKANLPENGPCIYIANHPNTLMDAWMIGYASKLPVYFMAKGTLFSSGFKNWALRSLNMIPVNRRGEETTKGVSNKDSFEACYRLMEEGKCLLIFPEGTSFLERKLRELKSGTARIALEASAKMQHQKEIKIIPIGLNYLDADKFRSSVVIQIGKAISIADYHESYAQNSGQAAKKLTELFRVRLEQVLVNTYEKELEVLVEDLHQLFRSKYLKKNHKGVKGDLALLKEIRDKIDLLSLSEAWKLEEIKERLVNLKQKLTQYDIRADFLDRRFRMKMFFRQLLFSFILIFVGIPVYLFGLIHNFFPFQLTDIFVPKLTKDIEYYAPLSVLLSLIFYPLFYLGFMFTAKYMLDLTFWEQLLYFASMPVFGLLTYSLHNYVKHVSLKWRFMYFLLYDKHKMQALKEEKDALRKLVFD